MECDSARRVLLEHDLGQAQRVSVRAALEHLDACDACGDAVEDYDRIRESLRSPDTGIEPEGGWPAFEQRLSQQVVMRSRTVRLMPAALAACITMAVTGWGLYLWNGHHAQMSGNVVPARLLNLANPSEQEIVDRMQVFDQVSQVFDHRAGWVLIADHGSDVGVGNPPATNSSALLLVRISISRDGALFSNADLVVVPGQTARTTASEVNGMRLRYEVTTSDTDPTHLRVLAEIQQIGESSPKRVGSLGSDLRVRLGQIVSIGQVVTGAGTYDVNVGLYRTAAGHKS
jgi:hypothetical protein